MLGDDNRHYHDVERDTHMDARLAFLFLNNFPVGKVPSPFSVTKMHVNHKKKKEDFDLINGL